MQMKNCIEWFMIAPDIDPTFTQNVKKLHKTP